MSGKVILVGALITVAAGQLLSAHSSDRQRSAHTPTEVVRVGLATHATKGIVKSVDATSLVIERWAGKWRNTTFALTPSTYREGKMTVGSLVEVRYQIDAGRRVVTVVRVQ